MLKDMTPEQLEEMSLIEVANELLKERKQAMPFQQIIDNIVRILDLSEEEVKARISQFYTDLNIDGRFINVADGWGLRGWYPLDQIEEEMTPQMKPKKKKAKKTEDDDSDVDDYDDLEEDLDYDDLEELDDDLAIDEDESDEDDVADLDEDEDDDDYDDLDDDEDDEDVDEEEEDE